MKDFFIKQITNSINVKKTILDNSSMIDNILKISMVATDVLLKGNKLLVAGNGGSAADAQHFVGELVSRFYYDRPSLPAIALTTDTSIITAIGNDYSYEYIFGRQIEGLGKAGDMFLGISTSGGSKNIVEALKIAKKKNIITVGLTGSKVGTMDEYCDYTIKVPSTETPRIQESHLLIEHLICSFIEQTIFPQP